MPLKMRKKLREIDLESHYSKNISLTCRIPMVKKRPRPPVNTNESCGWRWVGTCGNAVKRRIIERWLMTPCADFPGSLLAPVPCFGHTLILRRQTRFFLTCIPLFGNTVFCKRRCALFAQCNLIVFLWPCSNEMVDLATVFNSVSPAEKPQRAFSAPQKVRNHRVQGKISDSCGNTCRSYTYK